MIRLNKFRVEMVKKTIAFSAIVITSLLSFSCKDDVLPKPSSYLRLDYPEAKYVNFENECPYAFEMNTDAIIKKETDCGFTIT